MHPGTELLPPQKSFRTQCGTNENLSSAEICGAVEKEFCIFSELVILSDRVIYEMGAIIESSGF